MTIASMVRAHKGQPVLVEARGRHGSVLVALLWCIALLALLVGGVLYSANLDLRTAKNQGDEIQAFYLAIAGAEKAKALLFHDERTRQRAARNHSGELYDAASEFRDIPLGRGEFRVIRGPRGSESGPLVYGLSDEESRLNINEADMDRIGRLPSMTPELAAGIIDWRDRDNNVSPGGAEQEYYTSFRPPYLPHNDRIQTARELLSVKDIPPRMLLAEDKNANGCLDPGEDEDGDNALSSGWSGLISFESRVRNKNAAGQDRIDVQTADETTLAGIPGLNQDIARAIIAHRDRNRIESIVDLLEVSAPGPQQGPRPGGPPGPGGAPPQAQAQPSGPKVIDEELFLRIGDDVTATSDTALRGAINVNTAEVSVLMCLPGMTRELAEAIVSYRSSSGFLPNVAHLLRVQGFSRELLKQLTPFITVRSETFRIVSEGRVPSSGARKQIELIVQLSSSSIDTLSYRENL